MNKEQKSAVVEQVAAQIQEAEAVFAVDYRGISVPDAAELRQRLGEAGARFRVVKNTLTNLAADRAGADELKALLEGPTAFTFVAADGDVALAAKALARFQRERRLLVFKGGRMNGEPLTAEQIDELARLPARDVLHGQLVAMIASPITGLVRTLNALIAGLAIQLKQIADEGMVPRGDGAPQPAAEESSEEPAEAPEEASQEADQQAQESEAAGEAEESSGQGEGGEPSTEAEQEQTSEESPSEGEQKEG